MYYGNHDDFKIPDDKAETCVVQGSNNFESHVVWQQLELTAIVWTMSLIYTQHLKPRLRCHLLEIPIHYRPLGVLTYSILYVKIHIRCHRVGLTSRIIFGEILIDRISIWFTVGFWGLCKFGFYGNSRNIPSLFGHIDWFMKMHLLVSWLSIFV